jgi:hypothetical protein
MSRGKCVCVLFLLLILIPIASSPCLVVAQTQDNGITRQDYLRGIKIDFTPPKIVQNSGSFFLLNITLTRIRLRPTYFSIDVLLRLKDDFGREHTVVIGSQPILHFPMKNLSFTVCVPCFTNHDLISDMACLFSHQTSALENQTGSIGVQIKRFGRWWIDDSICRFMIRKLDVSWPLWSSNQASDFFSSFKSIINWQFRFRLLQILQDWGSHRRAKNDMIEWQDTNIVPSFASSNDVYFDVVSMRKETTTDGKFNVTMAFYNNLDMPIQTSITIDLSDQSFLNTIMPMLKGNMIYNVGYGNVNISPKGTYIATFNCSFPDRGFNREEYPITIESAPYISVGRTNIYGAYFYNVRFQTLVKPYYVVNASALALIQNVWYNLPIFYGTPSPSQQIFQTNHSTILYQGKTQMEKTLDQATDTLLSQPAFFFILLFLIGIPYSLFILLILFILERRK